MIRSSFSDNTSLRQIRLLCFLIAFAFLYSLLSIFLQKTDIVRDWENRFQSNFYLLRTHFSQPEVADLPLILVLIDDNSLPAGASRSPIDRSWLAELVSELSNYQPALIGMNILLDRTSNPSADNELTAAIETAGNVILRSDPFYPAHPLFTKVALDKGTLRFRLDSSDTVQEVCASALTCQSTDLLYLKILDHYRLVKGKEGNFENPEIPWLKINFAAIQQESEGKKILSYPVIKAHELSQLPDFALKDKIVLLGAGFPDLYPLYRAPLSSPEMMLQETEVIAQVLDMIAGQRGFDSVSPVTVAIVLFFFLICITVITIYKGSPFALPGFLLIILMLLVGSGWAFAFKNLEIPFVLPALSISFYVLVIVLVHSVQERFFRMETELQLKQTKIDYLTNELHSHHLFNEFSRLSVMIGHDPKAAKEYLVEFAEMLRSSLKYGDKSLVATGIQLEYLKSYLNQQRLIFKEKLIFKLTLDEELNSVPAPWHVFFPLVENAVKYTEGYIKQTGVTTAEIEVDLSRQNRFLVFRVGNPYREGLKLTSSKTGLRNLKERLSWAYPRGGYQLDFGGREQTWTAELRLPIG
ncbi:CHASE2 domain-containing protein [bacterium]|nr:CHASE2 domain-containing protein [bacterium]